MRAVEKRLREKVRELESELTTVKADREKFRKYWAHKFRWFIELQGKSSTPNMPYMIEDMAKFFQDVQWWYW